MEGDRLMVGEILLLNRLDTIGQVVGLSFEQRDARQDKILIVWVTLVARLVKVEQIHDTIPSLETKKR